ncbi:MAG: PilZ domain-containing protein [Planctomycetes bacterium]|nr:PilZ domain-containing protein [Planctomycetota bacterium]
MLKYRKKKRWQPLDSLPIYNSETDELVGRLGNITMDGVMIISDKAYPVNEDCSFYLQVPLKKNETGKLRFEARSLWSDKQGKSNVYHSGYRFLSMTPRLKVCIQRIIVGFTYMN